MSNKVWYVYIVRCNDGSLYTGITNNLEARINRHNQGRASKYTRVRRPVKLLYAENYSSRSKAQGREVEIKKFSSANKQYLVKHGKGQKF